MAATCAGIASRISKADSRHFPFARRQSELNPKNFRQIAVTAPLCAAAINPAKQLRTIGDAAAVTRRSANDRRMIECGFQRNPSGVVQWLCIWCRTSDLGTRRSVHID
jgi:hypothetical protein